jgi:DNA-binding transcriptional LysR family regulator
VNLRGMAAEPFVAFTRHRGPAYFDRTIRLCGDAGFSPRIRYEASTLHGVLDLVGAELGIALVPASAALLGARGVVLRRLRQRSRGDMLTLLTRRRDARPLLAALAEAVEVIFAEMRSRLAALSG